MSSGPEEIAVAIRRLRAGGLVAFPTETVYGLGASALDERAVDRVFALKRRPANNPLIVHVSSVEMARRVVADWPDEADELAQEFWPGPLSIVLPKARDVPANVTAGGANVAVRCPDHPLALALLEAFGLPLVGPSANPSGGVSPTRAEHVRESFSEQDVFVLDGGPCIGGIESTVVSLAGSRPVELRSGLITPEQIEQVIGVRPEVMTVRAAVPAAGAVAGSGAAEEGAATSAAAASSAPLASPGQLSRHYAPRTPARWFTPDRRSEVTRALAVETSRPVVVVTPNPAGIAAPHQVIPLPADPAGYAAQLYQALREADAAGAGMILIELPPAGEGIVRAIHDRVRRAGDPWMESL